MDSFRTAVKKAMTGKEPAPPKPAPEPKVKISEAQRAFIDRVGKIAQADEDVLPSLTVAQAILESGWGRSELAQKANALFGVKAGSAWKGPRMKKKTSEHICGKQVEITAAFRAYGSWEESIADHNALLRGSRYKAVQGERDYKKACRAVHAAGYATAQDYADKLIRLIEQYGLTAWDAAPIVHTIGEGDTLWALAVKYLGSGGYQDVPFRAKTCPSRVCLCAFFIPPFPCFSFFLIPLFFSLFLLSFIVILNTVLENASAALDQYAVKYEKNVLIPMCAWGKTGAYMAEAIKI